MLTHPEMTAVDIRQRVLVPYRPDAEMVAAVPGLSLQEYIKLAIAVVALRDSIGNAVGRTRLRHRPHGEAADRPVAGKKPKTKGDGRDGDLGVFATPSDAVAAVGPALTKMLGRCRTQEQRLAAIYGRWWLEPADRGR